MSHVVGEERQLRVEEEKHHNRRHAVDDGGEVAASDAKSWLQSSRVERREYTNCPQGHGESVETEEAPRKSATSVEAAEIRDGWNHDVSPGHQEAAGMNAVSHEAKERT